MPKGFFNLSTLAQSKEPPSLLAKCGACGLYKDCQSPKMPVSGGGRAGILIVGDAPGHAEDRKGRQFAGEVGRTLEKEMHRIGQPDFRKDCWFTNALICHPGRKTKRKPEDKPENKDPTNLQVGYCRPNLIRTIKELKPKVIILLGQYAVQSLIGWAWKEDVGHIDRWRGWRIPLQRINAWVCPTWSPAYILRNDQESQSRGHDENEVRHKLFWKRDLKNAFACVDRKWVDAPSRDAVQIVYGSEATAAIDRLRETSKIVAFDYETNMIKPDSKEAAIFCCSVSNGEHTIAFPWTKGTRSRMQQLLLDKNVKKIASNLKFEERWTLKEFGHGVKGWSADTMQMAHVLDSRPDITGLKFQAFVHFGLEGYDDHIKPLLRAKAGKVVNQINEVELSDLLLYCGLDSLAEYKLSKVQCKELRRRK